MGMARIPALEPLPARFASQTGKTVSRETDAPQAFQRRIRAKGERTMNIRNGTLLIAGAAALALILLVVLGAQALQGDAADTVAMPENGSLLHPQVVREERPGYVLAELYQDVHLDVASGVYGQDGILQDRYWSHDAATQTCSIDLTLADQHGRDEIAPVPTSTPEPTPTVPVAVMPAPWTPDGTPVATPYVFVPTRTPTPNPPPTTTPAPAAATTAATNWSHWKGRPVAIEADGLATIDAPRDAVVSAYLSIRTGPNSGHNSHTELARMPLPDAAWADGSAYVALPDASGRILLESDAIDANYRSALLHLEASPLPDCQGLRLRWQRAAAVVVKALTDNPFADWGGRAAAHTHAGQHRHLRGDQHHVARHAPEPVPVYRRRLPGQHRRRARQQQHRGRPHRDPRGAGPQRGLLRRLRRARKLDPVRPFGHPAERVRVQRLRRLRRQPQRHDPHHWRRRLHPLPIGTALAGQPAGRRMEPVAMKRTLLTIVGIIAVAVAVASVGFVLVATDTSAQGTVPQLGLPGRYGAAFTGAGIETGALLGPFCKSASVTGSTLSIVCEDDDDPANADAATTFTDVSVSSASLAGSVATFTKSDGSAFTLAGLSGGAGSGGEPTALVGIAFDRSANLFTFTRANGTTLEVDLDADHPPGMPQTVYVGTRATDDNFVATDFTNVASGASATGVQPLTISTPAGVDATHRVAWALPAVLTIDTVAVPAWANDNVCIFATFDCSGGTAIDINGAAYTYYPLGQTSAVGNGMTAIITWTE